MNSQSLLGNVASIDVTHRPDTGAFFRLGLFLLLAWFGLKLILELIKMQM
jgi:hypothetical protein